MSKIILGQVTFLLVTLCCGMALIFFYEVLRLLRWISSHPAGLIWIEDILYWAVASIPVFYIFFIYNDGEIRWYGVLMLLMGAWLYEYGISRPVRGLLVRIFGCHKPSFLKWLRTKIHIKGKRSKDGSTGMDEDKLKEKRSKRKKK